MFVLPFKTKIAHCPLTILVLGECIQLKYAQALTLIKTFPLRKSDIFCKQQR